MINLDEVHTGDLVAIQDGARNIARGGVRRRDTTMWIQAFGVMIPFLRLTATQRWKPYAGIAVIEHTPALVGSEPA
jgi:hypothetical protein